MLKLKQSLVAAAGAALVTFLAATAARAQKAVPPPPAPPQNVKVINSPSEPVPVTGTVSVSNIGTEPLPVRDVDNPARRAVHASGSCTTTTHGCAVLLYTVPAGKRLVIEYVSLGASLPVGQTATLQIQTRLNDSFLPVIHHVNQTPAVVTVIQGTGNRGYVTMGQQVRIYDDEAVGVIALRNDEAGQAEYSFTISGYLIDMPQQ